MAGRNHWLLLRESLVSLHRTWASIPDLTVVSDGSWTRDEFLKSFDFWPGSIRVLTTDEIFEPLNNNGQNDLVKLAKAHPLGLKLATIIRSAQQEAVLFVDSDILWFADPIGILNSYNGFGGPVTAIENGRSYNENLVQRFCPEGLSSPGVNTGCVYLKGKLCEESLLQNLLTAALENPGENFNEQTIIAIAVQNGGRKFPSQFCLVDFADALTWKRRKPWREGFHSRHYVNWMRHQFYRDAMALRQISA